MNDHDLGLFLFGYVKNFFKTRLCILVILSVIQGNFILFYAVSCRKFPQGFIIWNILDRSAAVNSKALQSINNRLHLLLNFGHTISQLIILSRIIDQLNKLLDRLVAYLFVIFALNSIALI